MYEEIWVASAGCLFLAAGSEMSAYTGSLTGGCFGKMLGNS